MLIPSSASHCILRPATLALRSGSSTRISLIYALHNNSFILRSRAPPVHKFHATSFPSATHRTTTHIRRNWRQPGWFDYIPRNYIIFGILGINGVVFATWSYVQMYRVRLPFARFCNSSVECSQKLTLCRARRLDLVNHHPTSNGSRAGYKITL